MARHDCDIPYGSAVLFRRFWTCRFCRRKWEREGKGAWRTNDHGGEIHSVTFKYPDGSTETFS